MRNNSTVLVDFVPLAIRQYYHINTYATSLLSLLLNALIITLVWSEPNRLLSHYSKVLTVNAGFDLLFSISIFFTEPVSITSNGRISILLNGQFVHLSEVWNLIRFGFMIFSASLAKFVLPVSIYFRYANLVKRRHFSSLELSRLYLLPIGLASIQAVLFVLGFVVHKNARPSCSKMFSHPLWTYGNERIENCLTSDPIIKNPSLIMFHAINACANTIAYAIMIYFSIVIFRELKKAEKHFDKKTLVIQRQINRLLVGQLMLPVTFAYISTTISIVCMMLQVNFVCNSFLFGVIQWLPVSNPLITILLVARYRRRLVMILRTCSLRSVSDSTIKNLTNTKKSKTDTRPIKPGASHTREMNTTRTNAQ